MELNTVCITTVTLFPKIINVFRPFRIRFVLFISEDTTWAFAQDTSPYVGLSHVFTYVVNKEFKLKDHSEFFSEGWIIF